MTARKCAKGPGLAGLSDDHIRRLDAKAATVAEVARELGVSRQALHAALQRRKASAASSAAPKASESPTASKSPAAAPPAASPAASATASPQKTSPVADSEIPPFALMTPHQRHTLLQDQLGTIIQLQTHISNGVRAYKDNKMQMGETAINASLRAMERVQALLLPYLVPPPEAAEGGLTKMVVEVMTKEDEDEIRAAGHQAFEQMFPGDDTEDQQQAAAAMPDPPPSASPTTQSARVRIAGPLPDRASYRDWLGALSKSAGRNYMRQIAGALGHSFGMGDELGDVIAAILHATNGDPERLRSVCDIA